MSKDFFNDLTFMAWERLRNKFDPLPAPSSVKWGNYSALTN
jgi:hypothetical protein